MNSDPLWNTVAQTAGAIAVAGMLAFLIMLLWAVAGNTLIGLARWPLCKAGRHDLREYGRESVVITLEVNGRSGEVLGTREVQAEQVHRCCLWCDEAITAIQSAPVSIPRGQTAHPIKINGIPLAEFEELAWRNVYGTAHTNPHHR